jgi:hypothetical protein
MITFELPHKAKKKTPLTGLKNNVTARRAEPVPASMQSPP